MRRVVVLGGSKAAPSQVGLTLSGPGRGDGNGGAGAGGGDGGTLSILS